jgi:hypothetical protein
MRNPGCREGADQSKYWEADCVEVMGQFVSKLPFGAIFGDFRMVEAQVARCFRIQIT